MACKPAILASAAACEHTWEHGVAIQKGPRRLTSTSFHHAMGSTALIGSTARDCPALLISSVMGPRRSSAAATTLGAAPGSIASAGKATT